MEMFQQWEKMNEKLVDRFLIWLEADLEEEDKVQRISYSLKVLLSEFEKFLFLVFLFGIINRLSEFFIVFLSIIPIRVFIGGSHRKTMLGCFFQSAVLFYVSIFLSYNFEMKIEMQCIIHIILLIEIWVIAPIQSAYRITYNKEQRIKFKAKALTVLLILSWIEYLLPIAYRQQIGYALLVQSVEIFFLVFKTKN